MVGGGERRILVWNILPVEYVWRDTLKQMFCLLICDIEQICFALPRPQGCCKALHERLEME